MESTQEQEKTVLIVEDDQGVSELVCSALAPLKLKIVQASSGEMALSIISATKIDLMILDLKLPDVTGGLLARNFPLIPFVVISGSGDEAMAVEMMKLGARDYLVKNKDFLKVVRVAVARVLETLETEAKLRKSEENLRRTQRRLELSLEEHPAGVWIVEGKELVLTKLNQSARLLGAGVEGFDVGFSLLRLDEFGFRFHCESGNSLTIEELPIARAVSSGKPVKNEVLKVILPDGECRWMLMNAAPIRDEEGSLPGALGIFSDITDRRLMDEERRRLEIRIQQAQKLESMSVMAGGIAHDFNNLLMIMMGHADIALSEMSLMAPARANVVQILSASRKAADLTRQMLIYTGKGRTSVEIVGLNEMIEEMTHLLEVSISKKSHIRFQFAADLPLIEGDPSQIRQIMMNLILNASEAIGDRSGIISLSTGVMHCNHDYLSESYLDDNLPEGPYVFLEIADTGCGMSRDLQERIFEPFFTTKFQGRGLGMAAVLGIVRSHRGAIKIYSEVGKGTTFKVLFPVSSNHLERRLQNEMPSDWHGAGKVLFVDDEESVRSVGRLMLEKLGFVVVTAENGLEALDRYRAEPEAFTLVILDLIMPKMGGEETFRQLRHISPRVRVLLSSGYSESEVLPLFQGKGLAGFIQKPYNLARLSDVLKTMFPMQEGPKEPVV